MKFLLLFFILLSCSKPSALIKVEGSTMGTYYKVTTYGSESPNELKTDIDKFLKFFNKIFSTYIPDSEISKINSSKFEVFKLSKSLNKVFELSLDISAKSHGYFDITIGPLVNAWGFGPSGKRKKPTNQEIALIKENIGYSKLTLKDARLNRPKGVYLDMSAVAKGFGVDELVKFLEFRGYSQMLVEIGGEIRTRGTKIDKSNWRVGIEGPSEALGRNIVKVVELNNLSMATSGSYRNFIKYGDEFFNHTIDPKTGKPTTHKTISVSVLSEYCADADAWATALMSMGHTEGLALANKHDLLAYFQYKDGDKVNTLSSDEFQKHQNK